MYSVYIHTNKINNKKYVGITKQEPKKRWRYQGIGYKGQRFYNAIQKYGWDNFDHDVLFTNLTKEKAEEIEVDLIAKYKTLNSDFGYNVHRGGDLSNSRSVSVDQYYYDGTFIATYEKIMDASVSTGIDFSQIAKCCRGDITHTGDFVWCYKGEIPNFSYVPTEIKRVEQHTLDGEFVAIYDSIIVASKETTFDRHGIFDCCNHRQKTAYGYYWCYEGQYDFKGKSTRLMKIMKYDLDGNLLGTYDNANDASETVDVTPDAILKCCNNDGCSTSAGFVWRYECDSFDKYPIRSLSKKIGQYDLKGVFLNKFASMSEASILTGVSTGLISSCCNNKRESGKGYIWRFVD